MRTVYDAHGNAYQVNDFDGSVYVYYGDEGGGSWGVAGNYNRHGQFSFARPVPVFSDGTNWRIG